MSPGGGRGGVGRRTIIADLSNFFFKPTEECRTSDWQRKSSMKSSFLFTPTLQPCYHGERKRPWETGVELNWPVRDIACSRRSDCGERVKSYAANANRNMRGKNEGRLWLYFFLSSIFRPRPTNFLPAPIRITPGTGYHGSIEWKWFGPIWRNRVRTIAASNSSRQRKIESEIKPAHLLSFLVQSQQNLCESK